MRHHHMPERILRREKEIWDACEYQALTASHQNQIRNYWARSI